MKTRLPLIIGLLIVAALIIPCVSATATDNGAQSGQHYTLNIIGSKNAKSMPDDLTGANAGGSVIFCPLDKGADDLACRIYLAEGTDFAVIDKDGTDGTARYMLPRPYAEGADVTDPANSAYRVYVRVLGAPGGTGKMITGLCNTTDKVICDGTGEWLSATNVTLASRNPSNKADPRQKFVDVTHELTTVDLSEYGYGHVGLFDNDPFGFVYDYVYFWDLYNQDMKIIQLRFYPIAT
jgi:hypothetical protein